MCLGCDVSLCPSLSLFITLSASGHWTRQKRPANADANIFRVTEEGDISFKKVNPRFPRAVLSDTQPVCLHCLRPSPPPDGPWGRKQAHHRRPTGSYTPPLPYFPRLLRDFAQGEIRSAVESPHVPRCRLRPLELTAVSLRRPPGQKNSGGRGEREGWKVGRELDGKLLFKSKKVCREVKPKTGGWSRVDLLANRGEKQLQSRPHLGCQRSFKLTAQLSWVSNKRWQSVIQRCSGYWKEVEETQTLLCESHRGQVFLRMGKDLSAQLGSLNDIKWLKTKTPSTPEMTANATWNFSKNKKWVSHACMKTPSEGLDLNLKHHCVH